MAMPGDAGIHAGSEAGHTTDRTTGHTGDRTGEHEEPAEVSTGQAADLLGVSRHTVVQLIERGDLPASRVGTRRRLATADVRALRERARSRRDATLRDVIAASRDLDLYR